MSKIDSNKPHLYEAYSATRRVQNAELKYFLPSTPENLSLKIIDSEGRIVLVKEGTAEKDPEEAGPSWFGVDNKKPSMIEGLNTYTWNLRYPGASEFEGMIIWSAKPSLGPIAPPGIYDVQLTVNNIIYKTSIEVKKDPRIEIDDEVIQEQFEFAMEIMNQTDIANKSIIEIRAIKERLETNKNSLRNLKKINTLIGDLEKIESSIYQVKNQSGQDPLNFPIKVNNRLAYLRKSVESGDGLPTLGSLEVFDLLKEELSEYVTKLNKLKSQTNKYF
jgi:hypothetical protein